MHRACSIKLSFCPQGRPCFYNIQLVFFSRFPSKETFLPTRESILLWCYARMSCRVGLINAEHWYSLIRDKIYFMKLLRILPPRLCSSRGKLAWLGYRTTSATCLWRDLGFLQQYCYSKRIWLYPEHCVVLTLVPKPALGKRRHSMKNLVGKWSCSHLITLHLQNLEDWEVWTPCRVSALELGCSLVLGSVSVMMSWGRARGVLGWSGLPSSRMLGGPCCPR